MKIYFAGAIRGGREKVNDYVKIVELLENYGEVLTKHVADPNLLVIGENLTAKEVYERDIEWLKEADIVFAEITMASLGVGYEIGFAESIDKKVVCMYEKDKNVSGMIRGNDNFDFMPYNDIDDLLIQIKGYMDNSM